MLNFGWCISVVAVGVQNILTKQIYGQTLFVRTTNIRGKSVSYVLDTTFKPCSVFLIFMTLKSSPSGRSNRTKSLMSDLSRLFTASKLKMLHSGSIVLFNYGFLSKKKILAFVRIQTSFCSNSY